MKTKGVFNSKAFSLSCQSKATLVFATIFKCGAISGAHVTNAARQEVKNSQKTSASKNMRCISGNATSDTRSSAAEFTKRAVLLIVSLFADASASLE